VTVLNALVDLKRALAGDGAPSSDFDLNPDITLPPGRKLRSAGVLVAIVELAGQPMVMLTKRSSALKHHPGQIAFPGGKVDPTDADPVAAALREAHEEIGLAPGMVTVLGTLSPHETVTAFTITPVVGLISGPFTPRAEPGEVDEVFMVPLSHVTDPNNFQIHYRMWRGARRHYFVVPYGPYYIWGATARILRGLAERLQG
jgi:8-oxo-dGTP pyrophosphatase MutT (NUDIX family)